MPNILVVHEETGKRDAICQALQANGCRTVQAANGPDALRLVGANTSFVIAHERLPLLDGWKMLECLKGHRKTEQVPVILLLDTFSSARAFAAQQKGAESVLPSTDEPEVIAHFVLGLLELRTTHELEPAIYA